jgi:hypothetical protein
MHLEHQDLTLWYGTSDAPAPEGSVLVGTKIAITVGIKPVDITNKIELLYKVNEGVAEKIVAEWLRHDIVEQAQYFIAYFPTFNVGDIVQYTVIGRLAGRQVPSPEEASQFKSSFRVISVDARSMNTEIDRENPPIDNSSANITNEDDIPTSLEEVTPSTEQSQELPATVPNLENRLNIIHSVLDDANHQALVSEAITASKGDITSALNSLQDRMPSATLQKATLAHSLADLSDDHLPVVKALAEHPDVNNLRDVALHFNVEKLAALVDPKTVSESVTGATDDEKKQNFAVTMHDKLFTAEPTAVLQRMVQNSEVPIADANLRTGVGNFLANQPDFNIRTTSIYTALQHPEAFKDIAEEHKEGVVEHLKTLQRVQAIGPTPGAVSQLMKADFRPD